MAPYAVTGATGRLGRLAVHELLRQGVPASDLIALVRTPTRAADLIVLGVEVREADYSRPSTLGGALAGVDRLLLISSSETGQRVTHHTNIIDAARTAAVSRTVYTSMLNADHSTNPLASQHRDTEHALRAAGMPFTLLRNGWYTENYTDQLTEYRKAGEIIGAAGNGRISAAPRQDYAAAAVAALLQDGEGDRTYELGGPAFDLPELARVITQVTGTAVTYRDQTPNEFVDSLQRAGLDADSARFVAALDTSIADGELETHSHDLARLLGRPPTPLIDVARAAKRQTPLQVGADVGCIRLEREPPTDDAVTQTPTILPGRTVGSVRPESAASPLSLGPSPGSGCSAARMAGGSTALSHGHGPGRPSLGLSRPSRSPSYHPMRCQAESRRDRS